MEFTVDIDQQGFKGTAKLNFPSRSERMKMLKELRALGYGQENATEGEMTDGQIELVGRLGDIVDERLLMIDVVHTETNTKIEDKGLMDVYSEGAALSGVLGQLLLGGVTMSKQTS